MPDDHNAGPFQPVFQDFEKSEFIEADDDSEYTSSLEYDPAGDHLVCGTPPNPREKRRMKGRSLKKAQERDLIAHLDQHKKRTVKDTKSRSYVRICKQQFADTEVSSGSSSAPASSNVVKVDTRSRIMCLNPKPVTVLKQADSLSDNDSQQVQRPGILSAGPQYDCPNDRYDFYRTFSTLIRLGNTTKKEKEPKGGGGGGFFGSSPYARQMSSEQELWQTHLCDLIWFELQAYINVRTNKDQDDFLCEAREEINGTLDRVMRFSASGVETLKEQVSTNCLHAECFCRKLQSGCAGTCLQQVVWRQCAISEMVTSLLDDVENAESLYPTQKALASEHPVYAEDKFQRRIATLCLWMTITRDIAHKIKLMAEIVQISDQSLVGTAWSCIDLHSLRTLVSGYSGKDVCVPNEDSSVVDDDRNEEDPEGGDSVVSETSSNCAYAASVPYHAVLRQKSVHFEDEQVHGNDAQCRSEHRRSRFSRPNSTDVTPTSIYRLYVDALLKKTGLRKLRMRLKELLDTTLQRARLALLPAGYNCQHGISHVSKVFQFSHQFYQLLTI